MKGYVHSYETFATLDGGGIRGMIFLSGCKYRCSYCHNPDTWATKGVLTDSCEAIDKLARNKSYYSNGGITISGGDPLVQSEFTLELLQGYKTFGLHTAIDTSACVIPDNIQEILEYTDLIILDIKFTSDSDYIKHCKGSIVPVFDMVKIANKLNKAILLRTVIIPNINDSISAINEYIKIAKTIDNLVEYELLAYHTLALDKYKAIGIEYELMNVPALTTEKLVKLQKYVDACMK